MAVAVLHAPPGSRNLKTIDQDALIDTGMWANMIADGVWQRYEASGLLERLHSPASATGIGPVAGPGVRIGGGSAPYSWGRLWVRLVDRTTPNDPNPNYRPLQPMPVVVQLLHGRVSLPYPLLFGLGLGILDGHRLTREPVLPWTPQPPDAHDSGTEFGQEWFLATA